MLEKWVPVGGQTAVFWGPWRVLGGFPLLDRFRCCLPPPLLGASWLPFGALWAPPGCQVAAQDASQSDKNFISKSRPVKRRPEAPPD